VDGGVHVLESDAEAGAPGDDDPAALCAAYAGWSVALESQGTASLLLARKVAAA
jgi:hypothetical protein